MSGPQRVIIDGYNVVYTDERLRRLAVKQIERGRDGLVDLLKSYLASRNLRVTLVFDGRGGLTESEAIVPGKLQVVYSPSGQSADDVIVDMVMRSGNPRQYVVVTSDQADIGSRLRPLGCEIIGSKRFLDRVKAAKPSPAREDEEEPPAGLGDTEYWLRKFESDGGGD